MKSEHSLQFFQNLSSAVAPSNDDLAMEQSCLLANIKAQCDVYQELASAIDCDDEIPFKVSSIVGLMESIIRQASAIEVIHDAFAEQYFYLQHAHQDTLQTLGETQKLNAEYRKQIKGLHQAKKKEMAVQS